MKIAVCSLVLEVTRKCNMACPHCLRGDSQCMDIGYEVIRKLIEQCDHIDCVTFTGGEPTLNLPAIKYFFDKCIEKYGSIPNFYLVTNGKEKQMELAQLLLWAYPRIDELEEYLSGVTISMDAYHEDVDEIARNPLRGLAFFRADDKAHSPDEPDNWIINSGRAYENGIGCRNVDVNHDLSLDFYEVGDEEMVSVEELYVSSNGKISSYCDASYDVLDEDAPCDIDTLQEYINAKFNELNADCAVTA